MQHSVTLDVGGALYGTPPSGTPSSGTPPSNRGEHNPPVSPTTQETDHYTNSNPSNSAGAPSTEDPFTANLKRAQVLAKASGDKDSPEAIAKEKYEKALEHICNQQLDQASSLLEDAATAGNQNALGNLKELASGGHAASNFRLGRFYEYKREFKLAVTYHLKAAEKNDIGSLSTLGQWYMEGNAECGIEKDFQKGVEYHLNAKDHGSAISVFQLKFVFSDCKKILDDTPNDTNALVNLGWLYEQGIGCDKNVEEAKRCYQNAADLGSGKAKVALNALVEKKD